MSEDSGLPDTSKSDEWVPEISIEDFNKATESDKERAEVLAYLSNSIPQGIVDTLNIFGAYDEEYIFGDDTDDIVNCIQDILEEQKDEQGRTTAVLPIKLALSVALRFAMAFKQGFIQHYDPTSEKGPDDPIEV
jgi:hypothetical protein